MSDDKDWIYSTNIYEVNLRQYTQEGTFKAFAAHLPRLKDMGVETLWFMPITPISQKNKKGSLGSYYACSDYTQINPEFGTLDDWKKLVAEAKKSGFKIIIDWVANHTGWDHTWTVTHPEWYKKDEATGNFKKASGMDDIIELDFENPAVVTAMIDAMKFWITETGIDGFRCDLAFWVELPFWKKAKNELEKIKHLFWFGELDILDNPEYMEVFDIGYTWRWMHQSQHFYQQHQSLHNLQSVLNLYKEAPGVTAWFTTNHDENSWNGTEYEKYGHMAKALAVFSCTWPGVPLIYSGQEIPNQKRLEFFEKDNLHWNEVELHDFYKTLLDLRKDHVALHALSLVKVLHCDQEEKVFSYLRKKDDNEVFVILNLSGESRNIKIPGLISGNFQDAFSKIEINTAIQPEVQLQAWEWLVLVK